MRDEIKNTLTQALKSKDKVTSATLRLVSAAIKDADIAARGKGDDPISDAQILSLLQKLVKQREESAAVYAANDRAELAAQEKAEIDVISQFLPTMMGADEVKAAVETIIAELGADGMKDMGRVIGELKNRFPGQIDMGAASGVVKSILAG